MKTNNSRKSKISHSPIIPSSCGSTIPDHLSFLNFAKNSFSFFPYEHRRAINCMFHYDKAPQTGSFDPKCNTNCDVNCSALLVHTKALTQRINFIEKTPH